jgi:hypothetical protein
MRLPTIAFPIGEHAELKDRLDRGLPIWTTRTYEEFDKYYEGMVLDTDFGRLVVVGTCQIYDIKDHPFYNELSLEQLQLLKNQKMDIIKLVKER